MKTELKLSILGNTGENSKILTMDNGKRYLSFSVAHNESYNDKTGKRVEKTTWISCLYRVADRSNGNDIVIEKGTVVSCEGLMDVKIYKKDNENKISITMSVTAINIIGKIERKETLTRSM